MMTKKKYRSLDLLKGLAKGWEPDLNRREVQVLLYVAQYGRQNEEGFAFVWHPMKGVEWWYQDMELPRRTFYRTIASLKEKGLLMSTPATDTWGVEGFGIPVAVMRSCANVGTDRVPTLAQGSATSGTTPPPLTSGNEVHNQGSNQSTNQVLTHPHPAGAVTEDPMYEDDFSRPKDGYDGFDVPKEAKVKPKGKSSPTVRLRKEFYEQWSIARCRNTSFGLAYNTQKQMQGVFKHLLTKYTEDDLMAMIKVFFDQAASGRIRLSGNEMWRDFLNNQQEVWRIVQSSATVSAPMEDLTDHNDWVVERRRRRLAELSADKAKVPA